MRYLALILAVSIFFAPFAPRAEASGFVGSGGGGGGGGAVTSAALDAVLGSTRGGLSERGASGWTEILPGTSGLPLVSQGAGADPHYAALGPTAGGTGLTAFTAGDLLYASATNTLARRAKGTDGQILTLVSGLPAWADGSGSSGWAYSSPSLTLTTSTDHVGIGTAPAVARKLDVLGDATYHDLYFAAGTGGSVNFFNSHGDGFQVYDNGAIIINSGADGYFSVYGNGNVVTNDTGNLRAQNATDGFLYIPRCATGAPSGTPTSITGAAALVVGGDHHLYAELTSGSWSQVDGGGSTPTLSSVLAAGSSVGGNSITSTSNGNIVLAPNGTGIVYVTQVTPTTLPGNGDQSVTVISDQNYAQHQGVSFGAGFFPLFDGFSARGTAASPGVTQGGDCLARFSGGGYAGGGAAGWHGASGAIYVYANETWGGSFGADIAFTTCAAGTATVAERWRILGATANTLQSNGAGTIQTTAGSNLTLDAGSGTTFVGAAGAGYLRATTVNAGSGSASTTATTGFVGTQSGAGTPTGVPATLVTGTSQLYVDVTNNKLFAYYGGAWHSLSP